MKTSMDQVRLAVDHAERCYDQQLVAKQQVIKNLQSDIDNRNNVIYDLNCQNEKLFDTYLNASNAAHSNLIWFIMSTIIAFIAIGYIVYTL